VQAIDVVADEDPQQVIRRARAAMQQMQAEGVLLLTDVFGATPCNVARQLNDGVDTRLVTGANLPMLLRSVCYRHESLEALASRAQSGGTQGIMPVGRAAPQNQIGKPHAPGAHDHQQ
jgi:PTS system ascorbate-specific IIA component